jgi:hypothetical protein
MAGALDLDLIPPWVAFPQMDPVELSTDQGLLGAWSTQVWWPFWTVLSEAEREIYLDHWKASDEWRQWLHFSFDVDPDFDAEADLAESEAWLKERAAERDRARPGFFRALRDFLKKRF